MPTFDIESEEITAFEFDDYYLFKQYFDEDELFSQLKKYYNGDKYRFEVPAGELPRVKQILDGYYYDLSIVDDIESYCVVREKTADSSDIIRSAVLRNTQQGVEIFLMKDQLSVEQAVEREATPLKKKEGETDGLER